MKSRDEQARLGMGQAPLERIFEQEFPRLTRLLARRFSALPAAEDVAQEAFLKFSQMRERVQDPPAFLTRVALNLAKNVLRSEDRRARYESYADLLEGDSDPLTPERYVLAQDEMHRLEQAVAFLPPACREVFRLHRLEGMTQAEIARRMGISTTAVEKSMRRAFARLSEALDLRETAEDHSGLGSGPGRCHTAGRD